MTKEITDRTGEVFGQWTVLETVVDERLGKKLIFYKAQCKCGLIQLLYQGNIKRSNQCQKCYLDEMSGDMISRKFNRLTIKELTHSDGNNKYYKCICDCGNERICNGSALRRGQVKQCHECKNNSCKTHGMKNTSIWIIWMGMLARCNNPKNKAYKNYGGRGIKVCKEWHTFVSFYADMGDRPANLQLDRIDNDKGYFKENCRWITSKENNNNKRPREH
jgi:hypothetical protein